MHPTADPSLADRMRQSLRQRGTALVLALVVEALLVLLFYTLSPGLSGESPTQPGLATFDVAPGASEAPPPSPRADEEESPAAGAAPEPPSPRPVEPPVAPEVEPPPPEVALPSNVIWMSRRDFAASSIANVRSPDDRDSPAAAPPGTGGRSPGDSELAAGQGPNGEPLYAAEWHVRPTRAQLSTYMPQRARQSGWGLIACRTVEGYRVEDCREIADSPRGSGLAGAVRQAAWQFRVRPPRVGGRAMVGSWVSIRIDYTIEGADG